jgi:hypothetical protein
MERPSYALGVATTSRAVGRLESGHLRANSVRINGLPDDGSTLNGGLRAGNRSHTKIETRVGGNRVFDPEVALPPNLVSRT